MDVRKWDLFRGLKHLFLSRITGYRAHTSRHHTSFGQGFSKVPWYQIWEGQKSIKDLVKPRVLIKVKEAVVARKNECTSMNLYGMTTFIMYWIYK